MARPLCSESAAKLEHPIAVARRKFEERLGKRYRHPDQGPTVIELADDRLWLSRQDPIVGLTRIGTAGSISCNWAVRQVLGSLPPHPYEFALKQARLTLEHRPSSDHFRLRASGSTMLLLGIFCYRVWHFGSGRLQRTIIDESTWPVELSTPVVA